MSFSKVYLSLAKWDIITTDKWVPSIIIDIYTISWENISLLKGMPHSPRNQLSLLIPIIHDLLIKGNIGQEKDFTPEFF